MVGQKYKILATKAQLNEVGVPYDITNLDGVCTRVWPTGYLELEVEHELEKGFMFKNLFDIPEEWLQQIKNEDNS